MKTKEEILKRNCHTETHPNDEKSLVVYSHIDSVLTAMQEYSDQQNAQLREALDQLHPKIMAIRIKYASIHGLDNDTVDKMLYELDLGIALSLDGLKEKE